MSEDFDYDGRKARRFAHREGVAWIVWAIPVIGVLIGAGVILSYCSTAANVATAPARVIDRTVETDNIIQNYEWFRQQYRDIQSFGTRIELAHNARDGFLRDAGPRSTWSPEDRYRYAQLNDNLTGLQAQRARMIETYNARSSMINRALFRGSDVPASIDQPPPIQ